MKLESHLRMTYSRVDEAGKTWRAVLRNLSAFLAVFLLCGCTFDQALISLLRTSTPPPDAGHVTPMLLEPITATLAPQTATPTAAASPTPTQIAVEFFDPAGCQEPPDDYSVRTIRGWTLNARTVAILEHANALYDGIIDLTNAVTQGSFTDDDPASFGTHAGGGAVDLSVRAPGSSRVAYGEVEKIIRALRVAGFAAWYRDYGELGQGSAIHIHAIAVGDRDLSPAAQDQLTGPFGYFRGYSGVPQENGIPIPDRHDGPILCAWMRDLGYQDLRPEAEQAIRPLGDWVERLRLAAQKYLASTPAQARQIANSLGFVGNAYEDPSNMCGPLAAAILRDAGLLPQGPGPVSDLKSYWLPNGIRLGGKPWTYFDEEIYALNTIDFASSRFDFTAWPLLPGDIVYLYAGSGEYDHLLVVTEVDAAGRAYTVTNIQQDDLSWIIRRVLLYDPADPSAGAFKNEFMRDSWTFGRTGLGGFDVLRLRGITLPSGSLYPYVVEPGDTIPGIAARFNSTLEAITRTNQLDPMLQLTVGQALTIPVNLTVLIEFPD
jgi:hypothetical protein